MKKSLKLLLPLIAAGLCYALTAGKMDEGARRVSFIFILAACYWVLEAIPIYATSLLIMFLSIILLSNAALPAIALEAGPVASYAEVFAAFAHPIIILFLGGLFLARAATKFQLDRNLASVILRIFGTRSSQVMLAIMLSTAVFSMFMSNTATTAMMLAIAIPIISGLDRKDPLRKALVLAVPIAANIGGIGTPIGTPPNAVALAALESRGLSLSFLAWMKLGVPFVIIMIAIAWLVLSVAFRSSTSQIELDLKTKFQTSPRAITVYIVFALTVLLWLTSSLHGVSSSVVAFIPVLVFSMTSIIDSKELRAIPWDILWLISGGLALGVVMVQSGFNDWIIAQVPFSEMPLLTVVIVCCLVGLVMATFISHTATANLLIPIAISLSTAFDQATLLLPVTLAFACSIAMALPISTPPNALAYGTGEIELRDLLRIGGLLSIIGIVIVVLFSFAWGALGVL